MLNPQEVPLARLQTAAKSPARILILTVLHGAGHLRIARALRQALLALRPAATISILNATGKCRFWFRLYYDSYQMFLRYWPSLWYRIEGFQHEGQSTGPAWLYRNGAAPLFRFIHEFDPDTTIATEVGMCELGAMLKREAGARFNLVAVPGLDVDRAWVQPEVDLYLANPGDALRQLLAAGAPRHRVVESGVPVDPAFCLRLTRHSARKRLRIEPGVPLLLVLFGGAGYGDPARILPAIRAIRRPVKAVLVAGENKKLQHNLDRMCAQDPRLRVLGWINNMHEWMAAADLMIGKTGEGAVVEALNARLPILAFDPLPGAEERLCHWIEREKVGAWARNPEQLEMLLARLLQDPSELEFLRRQTFGLVAPNAAQNGAEAILRLHREALEPGFDLRVPFQPQVARQH